MHPLQGWKLKYLFDIDEPRGNEFFVVDGRLVEYASRDGELVEEAIEKMRAAKAATPLPAFLEAHGYPASVRALVRCTVASTWSADGEVPRASERESAHERERRVRGSRERDGGAHAARLESGWLGASMGPDFRESERAVR